MMLNYFKSIVAGNLGICKTFKFLGSRNMNEEFKGTIISTFSNIFLIKTLNGELRSYSYNDLLIGLISILD